jgi:uncharacterized damage-inducible protein DinB
MNPAKAYDYLMKTRAVLLDAMRGLPPTDYNRSFEIGMGRFDITLTHIWISEWYYVERMQQHDVPAYSDWPVQYEKPPEFGVIEKSWRKQAEATRKFITVPHDWDAEFTYTTAAEPGEARQIVTVTIADLFTQLAFHEVHHRAQLMAMLRQCGKSLGDIDFNMIMYKRVAQVSDL